jgi:hypothetical protein
MGAAASARRWSQSKSGGWGKLGAVLMVSAVTGALLYLRQHPLPGE